MTTPARVAATAVIGVLVARRRARARRRRPRRTHPVPARRVRSVPPSGAAAGSSTTGLPVLDTQLHVAAQRLQRDGAGRAGRSDRRRTHGTHGISRILRVTPPFDTIDERCPVRARLGQKLADRRPPPTHGSRRSASARRTTRAVRHRAGVVGADQARRAPTSTSISMAHRGLPAGPIATGGEVFVAVVVDGARGYLFTLDGDVDRRDLRRLPGHHRPPGEFRHGADLTEVTSPTFGFSVGTRSRRTTSRSNVVRVPGRGPRAASV